MVSAKQAFETWRSVSLAPDTYTVSVPASRMISACSASAVGAVGSPVEAEEFAAGIAQHAARVTNPLPNLRA